MTSRQEMQEQETFVFEARVFRRVIYRQEKTVQVRARCEDDAAAAIAEACGNAYGSDDLPDNIEVKVTRPDGSTELEVFEIYGATDHPEQDSWPDAYEEWEFDGCEEHSGYEEARAAASKLRQYDEASECWRMANPELPRRVPRNEFGRVTWRDTWTGTASALCDRGLIEAASGNHADAVTWFDGALSKDSQCALAYYNRGLSYAALGVHSRALADQQTAFLLDPELRRVHEEIEGQ